MAKLHALSTCFGALLTTLLGLSSIAANLSTAFPPPPSATLSVPIIVMQCPRHLGPLDQDNPWPVTGQPRR